MDSANRLHGLASITLQPVDLESSAEVDELLHQRRICGWKYLMSDIEIWREKVNKGRKSLFWIVVPSSNNIRAGHISLDSEANPPHELIARHDRTLMTITMFFVMPEFRSKGVGGQAMNLIEDMAKHPPHGSERCEAVVVDTMRKADEDGPHVQIYREQGLEPPVSGQPYYEKRGYVVFHEEKRYAGSVPAVPSLDVTAAFMKKQLR